jgi:isoleucyl-tRNA synthetase
MLLAPITPFMAEDLYQALGTNVWDGLPESVHLHPWIKACDGDIDLKVENQMDAVREIASLGHSARASQKLKVRQPLAEAIAILVDKQVVDSVKELSDVICEELNVKKISFADNAEKYVSYEIKPNFRVLGSKLGKDMKKFASALSTLDASAVCKEVQAGGKLTVAYEGGEIEVGEEELDIRVSSLEGYTSAQGLKSVVVLDTNVTDELVREGYAREIVSRIQAMRKDNGLEYADRISVRVKAEGDIFKAAEEFSEHICSETLCVDYSCEYEKLDVELESEIDKQSVTISFKKT